MAKGTAVIPASQSAYLFEKYPDKNYGESTEILVGRAQLEDLEGVISWDFGIYKNKAIHKAVFKFYLISDFKNTSARTPEIWILPILKDWDEKTITYNTARGDFYSHVAVTSLVLPQTLEIGYELQFDLFSIEKKQWSWIENYGLKAWPVGFTEKSNIVFMGSSRHSTLYPRIEIEWEDVGIVANPNIPIGGLYQNPRNAIAFTWSISGISLPGTSVTAPTIAESKFRWRYQGTSSYTEINLTASGTSATASYTMPANTLQAQKNVEWQVLVKSDENVWSEASAWQVFTTAAGTTFTTPLSPVNAYIDRGSNNTFRWSYEIGSDTPITRSELQYSTDGNNWLPLAMVNGAGLSVVIPADTLPLGSVYWRVRTYNLDGVAGNWSDNAAIIVQGQTPKPVIQSFNAASRLYAIWNAVSAISSQVQIRRGGVVLIDSGEIFTPMYLGWLSPEYLPNGSYTFAVRVKSPTGQWSDWTTRAYTVNMPPLAAPQASYTTGKGFVEVQVANFYDYTWVYLLRDGVKIARLTHPNYIDWTAGTVQQYQVQGLLELDGYANSEPQTVPCLIQRGCLLSGVANPSALLELYVRRNEPVSFAQGREYTGTLMHFAGREYPVMEFSTFSNETVEISLTARTQEEWKKIQELLARRETILYRDRYGQRLFGVALGITSERDPIARDYSITIQRVDYKEDVPYLSKEEITGL